MTQDNKTPEDIIKQAKRLSTYTDWSEETIENNTKWIVKLMHSFADQEKRKAQIYLLEYCIKEFKKRKGYLPPHSYLELIKENIENGSTMHQQFNNKN